MQFGLYAPIPMATVGSPEVAKAVAEALAPLPEGRLDAQFDLGVDLLLAADRAGFELACLPSGTSATIICRLGDGERDRLAARAHPGARRRPSWPVGSGDDGQARRFRSTASARAAWHSTSSTAGSTRNSACSAAPCCKARSATSERPNSSTSCAACGRTKPFPLSAITTSSRRPDCC